MIPKAVEVRLSPEDGAVLEGRVRSPATTQRDAVRARIVLLAAEGRSTRSIADAVGVMANTVSTWRARYADAGLAGLADKPRPGPKPKYTVETGKRVLAVLEGPPPAGFGRWSGPLIAAALDLATGKVAAAHQKRRRRVEFLAFMDAIVAAYPDKEIHAVLDNLNTHKKNEEWLAVHPNVRFHFTPTRASWLNQVEIWFSILSGKSLRGASFTSLTQLRQHIDDFIARYNADAFPFAWTKPEVHQKRFKARRISQL